MGRIDNLDHGAVRKVVRRVRQAGTATPGNNMSIGRNGLRVHDGGVITIENGGLKITGTAEVIGQLIGSGALTWTGGTSLQGPTTITGALGINGPSTLNGNLTVAGGGRIKVGVMTLDPTGGTFGGALVSANAIDVVAPSFHTSGNIFSQGTITSNALLRAEVNASVGNNLTVGGDSTVGGVKSFRIPHPTKPGMWLQHGSTESPVSGTEYTGVGTLDANGECVVVLPDYFEDLNKPAGRTVQITPVGRPFMVGADPVTDGRFTVYGAPDREFGWLVKAERIGADFLVESQIEDEVTD